MQNLIGWVIVLGVTAYFITQQFKYAKVTKFRYYLMPVFALGQFVYTVRIHQIQDLALLIGIIVFSSAIGYYQTKNFQFLQKERVTQSFVVRGDEKIPVMRKVYYSRGGASYLIGWFVIFLVQLVITFSRQSIATHQMLAAFLMDVLTSLFVFLQIGDVSSWWVWELYTFSSLSYYFVLIRRHAAFSDAMKQL